MSQWSITKRPRLLKNVYGLNFIKSYFYEKAKTKDWPRAVMLQGHYGTGKTTIANILASMMTCNNISPEGDPCLVCPTCKSIIEERWDKDILFVDGGDSGKADLIERVSTFISTPPFYGSPCKVIIIEEVQELSKAAKNSLLKILESSKIRIHFILLSMEYLGNSGFGTRVVPFNFKKITTKELMIYLKETMEGEGLWSSNTIPNEFKLKGLATIAQVSKGSIRQALQLLELCIVSKCYSPEDIHNNLGIADEEMTYQILLKLLQKDPTVWSSLLKYDPFEYFALSYKILTDALMYKVSNYLEDESNEFFCNNTKTIAGNPNFPSLLSTYEKLSPLSKPFLRKADLIFHIASYFSSEESSKGTQDFSSSTNLNMPVRQKKG